MATNFSVANDFNIFVLENHTANSTDSEGRVAVGGTASYVNYGVGNTLSMSKTRGDLIVGGSINIAGGTNFNGNTIISSKGTVVQYTMTNNNGVPGEPLVGDPIDFKAMAAYLKCASLNWGALAANGTAVVEYGGLTLTGTDKSLNIFTINTDNVSGSGTVFGGLNQVNIVAPGKSTILINMFGNTVNFGSFQIFRNGVAATGADGQYILWNLPQTTTLMPNTTSIKGSLLAPGAVYMAGYSNVEGTIMVHDLNGFAEAHNYPFKGALPEVCGEPVSTTTTGSTTTSTSTTTTSTTSTTSTSTASTTTSTSTSTSTASTTTSTSTSTSTASTTTSTSTSTSTASTTTSTSTSTSTASTTTSTSTSTSTTTSTTSTSSTTTQCPARQAVTDVLESIALEQTALSHILNAEGEKIQKAVAMDLDLDVLLAINNSVKNMVKSITLLESILLCKAEKAKNRLPGDCE